jgi:hypothetical protein
VIAGDLDAWHLLGDVPERAQRLGAGAPSLVGSGLGVAGDWVGGFVDVPLDECLLGYARAGSSIADVDVAVYSEDGAVLAEDEGRDVHPTVVLCAPHPARVYVAAHVAEGGGLVAVGANRVPKERAVIIARAMGARGLVAPGSRPADVGPGLEDAVRRHHLELGGTWEEVRRLGLNVDSRVPAYAAIAVDADHCVDALVVPGEDVGSLDAEVLDADGRAIARSRDGSGPRGIIVCSTIATTGTLVVRPHAGRGLTAIVLARADADIYRDISARPEVAWVTPRDSLQTAKSSLAAALSSAGYPSPVTTSSGVLTLAARVVVPVDLRAPEGACERVDVIAGEPLALVDVRLWSDGGKLLASEQAPSSAVLFACGRGPARLELECRGRPGPFALTVRPERWKDAVFQRFPLAASRMLARATSGSKRLLEGAERSTRAVSLDAASVVSWSETVPAGRCARWAAGVQGEGAGLELRAFDEMQVELDRAEGPSAAMVRVCSLAGSGRAVRLEIRASAGHVDAVVGERLD